MIYFFLNLNDELEEDFNIKPDEKPFKYYYDIIKIKPGELVFFGYAYHCNGIQFFEINSRKLKEKIFIEYMQERRPVNRLCMINDRCLCAGTNRNITVIDIYNKSIIRKIEFEGGCSYTLCKLNDNILLSDGGRGIIQWKITPNNLQLISKNVHQSSVVEIIKFGNSIVTCSFDKSIKIW